MRLGGFRLDAAAELGLGHDDNLFVTRRDRRFDGFGNWGGEAALQSDWSTHAIGLTGRVEQRRYFDNDRLDWTDYAIGAFRRYDITPDTSVAARLSRVQGHLDVSSVDVQQSEQQLGPRGRPIPFSFNEAQLQGQTRFNRLGVVLLGNWRGYSFEDVDLGPASAPGQPKPGDYSRLDFDSALASLDRRDHEDPDEHATDAYGIFSARWLINRNLSLVGSYQHSRRIDSSATIEEYDRNLFLLRLRIAL